MSASLVGSEMCIRDRTSPPPAPARDRWRQMARARPHRRALRMTQTAPPVSYTHLTLPTICSV
eukprot:1354137-Alexandrium_andersonii.AAC.1